MAHKHVQTLVSKKEHIKLKLEAAEKEVSLQHLLWRIITKYLTQKEDSKDG